MQYTLISQEIEIEWSPSCDRSVLVCAMSTQKYDCHHHPFQVSILALNVQVDWLRGLLWQGRWYSRYHFSSCWFQRFGDVRLQVGKGSHQIGSWHIPSPCSDHVYLRVQPQISPPTTAETPTTGATSRSPRLLRLPL